MDSEEGLYVFLPSNVVNNNVEKPNTLSHYVTELSKPLEFKSSGWHVALCEATYPVNIINIPEDIAINIVSIKTNKYGYIYNVYPGFRNILKSVFMGESGTHSYHHQPR